MIRTLQRKFVFTAMTAVTVLILLMLGAINLVNIVIVKGQVTRTLEVIMESERDGGRMMAPPGSGPPGFFMREPKNDYDTVMSSNFFVVGFSPKGAVIYVDTSRTSAVTDQEAEALAREAYQEGGERGKIGKYRYLWHTAPMDGETVAVFLDISGESVSYLRVLLLSGLVGLACWTLMLVFVAVLSRRAIRPISENIERQKQFVTNAGHEIKTPLAIIRANTEAMELYKGENKWSRNIREQTERLDGLVKRLLVLARMEERDGGSPLEKVDVSRILEESLQDFRQPMEGKCLRLETEIEPGLVLKADQEQMRQLCSILLENALKYTDQGGKVWLRLHKNHKGIRLELANTCAKLPPAPPEKLFERFYRGDDARTQEHGGYGIGLSIARSVAEANGGAISAVYQEPGRICFTVAF